mmetsp:Transcript_13070/g.28222  ORF Transcript_13070/g.28222 Transcript_13070/m.28222 type:complete len:215 (-) Transcript_13070:281-925(-)
MRQDMQPHAVLPVCVRFRISMIFASLTVFVSPSFLLLLPRAGGPLPYGRITLLLTCDVWSIASTGCLFVKHPHGGENAHLVRWPAHHFLLLGRTPGFVFRSIPFLLPFGFCDGMILSTPLLRPRHLGFDFSRSGAARPAGVALPDLAVGRGHRERPLQRALVDAVRERPPLPGRVVLEEEDARVEGRHAVFPAAARPAAVLRPLGVVVDVVLLR